MCIASQPITSSNRPLLNHTRKPQARVAELLEPAHAITLNVLQTLSVEPQFCMHLDQACGTWGREIVIALLGLDGRYSKL